jgi:uncharacterized membrane protein
VIAIVITIIVLEVEIADISKDATRVPLSITCTNCCLTLLRMCSALS